MPPDRPPAPGPVLVDVCGTQSLDHRDRGISRYVFELCLALDQVAGDLVGAYLVNPDLALPKGLDRLMATGKVRPSDEAVFEPGSVLHVTSPYELSVPLRRLLPRAAVDARTPVVVTLYDLIPELLADPYLTDPGLRQRYRARHHLVRDAAAVLTLSQATARDAIALLGLGPDRVVVAGAGVGPEFTPPESRDQAAAEAAAAVAGLRPPFALYTGGTDQRKNVEGLLTAWARLPVSVRTRVQLVIACALKPLERNHLEVIADRYGLIPGRDVALPGFVPEATLRLLYQGTELFVYPSLYEGYGLPIAEALASGAVVVAADRSCLPELVRPPALFDPMDPDAMAATIAGALAGGRLRPELLARAGVPPTTWTDVARRTAQAYETVLADQSRRPGRVREGRGARRRQGGRAERLRVAFATPLPPQPSGVADYSYLLLDELRRHVDVTALVDGPPHLRPAQRAAVAPEGVEVRRVAALERVEALEGRFDAVVYSLGNSEFHTGALAALRRRPGVVLAHEVRLSELYRFGPHQHPGAVPGGFHATLQAMYAGRVPPTVGSAGALDPGEGERCGTVMAREVIALSELFLAGGTFAADLARLDADPVDRHKIGVLPMALGVHAAPPPSDPARPNLPPLVVSFGLVNAVKQTGLLIDAFAIAAASHPDAALAVVGPCGDEEAASLRARAAARGVSGRVTLTGRVDEAEYAQFLARGTVAVQLRASSNGETSAATGGCLVSAVPTITTAIGAVLDLSADTVVSVPPDVTAAALAQAISGLLADPGRRRTLGRAAAAYAEGRSFSATAAALAALLQSAAGAPDRPGGPNILWRQIIR